MSGGGGRAPAFVGGGGGRAAAIGVPGRQVGTVGQGRFNGNVGQQFRGNRGQFSGRFDRGRFDHGRFDRRRHFRDFAFGFGFWPGYYDDYYAASYYDDCYQLRRVHTRYGWRRVRVNVCDYYGYY
jgi:hypothetical protein